MKINPILNSRMMRIISQLGFLLPQEMQNILQSFVMTFPHSNTGDVIRRQYWKRRLGHLGRKSLVRKNTFISYPKNVEIGDETVVGPNCALGATETGKIYIGNHVLIARGTYLHPTNHKINDLSIPISKQGYSQVNVTFHGKNYGIVVEDDVWIGSNVVLTAGAHIQRGSVIAASCVVPKGKYPPYSVLTGNPARVAFNRKEKFGNEQQG